MPAVLTDHQLGLYLKRIGYHSQHLPQPNIDTLRAIQTRQSKSIAFENLALHHPKVLEELLCVFLSVLLPSAVQLDCDRDPSSHCSFDVFTCYTCLNFSWLHLHCCYASASLHCTATDALQSQTAHARWDWFALQCKQRGERITTDLPAVFHKLVEQQRGGYCFEANALLAAALRALGFQLYSSGARYVTKTAWQVLQQAARPICAQSHISRILTCEKLAISSLS